MTSQQPLPIEIISQPAQLITAIQDMSDSPIIAIDTESNSFHRYPEQLCLIQVADNNNINIFDTISLKDLDSLKTILEDNSVTKVLHSADYDIRSLDRHHGVRIRNVYDVKIAAVFAGINQFSLVNMVRDIHGITLPKSKRLQKADWAQRPLSSEAIEYAANDVRYLITLKEILDDRLQVLGRAEWVAEECVRLEDIRYVAQDVSTGYLSVKGTQKLNGQNLAILKSLYLFREREARRWRRPPLLLIPNSVLSSLSSDPDMPLSEVPGLGKIGLRRFSKGFKQALREGLAAAPIQRLPNKTHKRWNNKQLKRLNLLKTWRSSLGEALSLDPALLWPKVSLERIAEAPDKLEGELESGEIRHWQREQFASSLKEMLKTRCI